MLLTSLVRNLISIATLASASLLLPTHVGPRLMSVRVSLSFEHPLALLFLARVFVG